MKIVLIVQGKLKDKGLRALVDDYLGRLKRYVRCEEIELKDAAQLLGAVPVDATLVALEVDGEELSSSCAASFSSISSQRT